MGIALVALKTGEQILSNVEIDENAGTVYCNRPLRIGWVRPDKKLTRILMQLSIFPPMISGVAQNLSGHAVTYRATDVLCILHESELKPEAVEQYRRESGEIYSGIEIMSGMPQELKGEA